MLNSYVVSGIRTVVPIIVGWLLAHFLFLHAFGVASPALAAAVSGALAGLWYLAARALERKWPALGWLLGYPAEPTYLSLLKPGATVTTTAGTVTAHVATTTTTTENPPAK